MFTKNTFTLVFTKKDNLIKNAKQGIGLDLAEARSTCISCRTFGRGLLNHGRRERASVEWKAPLYTCILRTRTDGGATSAFVLCERRASGFTKFCRGVIGQFLVEENLIWSGGEVSLWASWALFRVR